MRPRPGATPEHPWGRRPYVVAGQSFPSRRRLEQEITRRREAHAIGDEFEDALIAEVVNTMHPEVLASPHRATRFCMRSMLAVPSWVTGRPPALWRFEAFFEPLGRWQDVTAYPWRAPTPVADLKRALRALFREHVRPRLAECCAVDECGRADGLEFDHIEPSFEEIAAECLALMTPEEITTKFRYDQFHPTKMALAAFIPLDHPAVVHLIATHRHPAFRWQWLCRPHHHQVTAERRRLQRERERPHVE